MHGIEPGTPGDHAVALTVRLYCYQTRSPLLNAIKLFQSRRIETPSLDVPKPEKKTENYREINYNEQNSRKNSD